MANQVPNSFKTMLWKGQIAAASDTFKIILMDTSYTFDKDSHNAYADISSSELPTANGYTVGGVTLSGVTITTDNTQDRCEVTFNNAQWTASGGSISTSGAIIFNDSTATGSGDDETDAICAYLDAAGIQVVADGAALTVSNIMLTAEDV